MFKELNRFLDLISNVGLKSVLIQLWYDFQKKAGLLKSKFPTTYPTKKIIGVEEWRVSNPKFFFNSKEDLRLYVLEDKSDLKKEFQQLLKGYLKFFNTSNIFLGKNYDWITNPENDYKYELKHWAELESSKINADDIRYVWEKSRFAYLHVIIGYDYHFKEDQSSLVFSEIESWIQANPINQGPNYVSSREVSFRVLNWIFSLNYYKKSSALTEEIFEKIINSIYWQVKHVAVRIHTSGHTNGHAIAESLLLYVAGLLFPSFPEGKEWKGLGRKILEEEGFQQINEDGTYIQSSFNEQRVILQLYTWAFFLGKINKENFPTALCERLQRSASFLYHIQDNETGYLPNYGSNEGYILFALSSTNFRDFRPQINSLFYYLHGRSLYEAGIWEEDLFWYTNRTQFERLQVQKKTKAFDKGGYYVLRDESKFSFIKCTSHQDHPSQADNLHVDIWVNGKNILRDLGSYKSKTTPEEVKFFIGTASHNTVMIGDYDQMEKGKGNRWYYWTEALEASIENHREWTTFKGKIHAYKHVASNIHHSRVVKQYKHRMVWEVEDIVENNSLPIKQIWNISPEFQKEGYEISCTDRAGNAIPYELKEISYTPLYDNKEPLKQLIFETEGNYFKSIIFKK